jgi:trigger factor
MCACPLYHYDHIIEYSKVGEHDLENIALLCGTHHDQKTRGHLLTSTVRRARDRVAASARRPRDGSIGLYFENNIVLLFGSNVVTAPLSAERPEIPAIVVDDTVTLGFRFEDGMPLINANIFDEEGLPVLRVHDSELSVTDRMWDITYVGTLLTLRQAERQISLQIRFNPAAGEIEIIRGEFYAEGVGLQVADGIVTVVNTGAQFEHNYAEARGFRFGVQTDESLRRALYSFGAVEIPRFSYRSEFN